MEFDDFDAIVTTPTEQGNAVQGRARVASRWDEAEDEAGPRRPPAIGHRQETPDPRLQYVPRGSAGGQTERRLR